MITCIIDTLCSMSTSDKISSLALLLALFSARTAWKQWKNEKKLKRAEYLNSIEQKLRTDDDLSEVFYKLEYDSFDKVTWYNKDFHDSELERKVDLYLSYLSYVCYLKQSKIISSKEFKVLEYRIERVIDNPNIRAYLYNLYHWSQRNNSQMSFSYLFAFAKPELSKIDDFFNC